MFIPLFILLSAGCDRGFADPSRELAAPVEPAPPHPVTIHQPTTLGVVDTPLVDIHGTPVGVACETCHGPTADPMVVPSGNPEDFHASVTVAHGGQTCFACHDREDRSRLQLADGQTLPMAAAMDLCAQCHGPQHRDYRAGSHGGMTGHWDLRQGPRERNHCIDCHSPHQPAYQGGMPVAPPRDRGTNLDRGDH